jgi:DNA-binding NarL/FixJ family response regulator
MMIAGFTAAMEASGEFSVSVCRDVRLLREQVFSKDAKIVLADTACGITLELLSELRAIAPATSLVLWVDTVAPEFINQAVGLGVLGVLSKDSEIHDCLRCLRHVAEGKFWLEHELSNKLVLTRSIPLTVRQRQLVGMLTQGLKNKEIAHRLGITEGTVKVYLSNIYRKTGANDRFELALFALKNLSSDQVSASKHAAISSDPVEIPNFAPKFLSFDRSSASVVQ